MKSTYKIVLILLMCGVYYIETDEVKSVMEGDSVTLNPDISKIQGMVLLLWRFGEKGSTIAQTDGKEISYPSNTEIFRGRLQLDHQTGSLTITNVRINHSGRYKAEINHKTGTSYQNFSVTVYESPSVIAEGETEMKLMSVKEGDPVTLHVPQIQGDELIVWRFGDEGKLIAKHDLEAKSSPLYYETDERFRDRLKLEDQTGSLIITNTRTTDSGLYKVKISSNKQTLYKRFIVTVSDPGYSGGAVAGIVFGVVFNVLLLAAAAAGVMYFYLRPRTTNLPNQMWSVLRGDDVTLNPETKIQRGDEIQWLFGAEDTLIAEIKGETREMTTHEGPDERFRDRLKLDEMTGSLTIESINTEHAGLYTLKIRRGRETFYKRFHVSVRERMIRSVMEGDPVTLYPYTAIQKDDLIQWLFGDEEQQTVLAELKGKTGEIFIYDDVADKRFRGRLKLNETTGSLIITNTRTAHTGVYRLQIISSSGVSEQIFTVTVRDKVKKLLLERDSVTLKPDTEIQRDDQILWMFGDQDKLIAQMKGGTVDIYDDVNERFRGRLKLDKMTGSLTITKIEAKHTGLYKLQIISSRGTLYKKFKVSIKPRNVEVTPGESVRLHTGLTEIQRGDEIEWRFGDENSPIAEIKGGTGETHDVPDERFRDRLELDEKTGDLIIKNSTYEHTGEYKLKIRRSGGTTNSKYSVTITERKVEVTAGESVRLNTDLNEIQRGNEIEWRFGDKNSLIAEIKGGTGETHDGPDERFRDRLELNKKTGDLTIKNSTAEHTGDYKLKIRRSGGTTNRTYGVNIRTRKVEVTPGESVRLHTGLTEIHTEDEIQWRFGDKNSLIAKMNGGTGVTHDGPDERFRDRLELNKKTGDLTIKNSTYEHTGEYKLKIRRSGGTTNSKYSVTITGAAVTKEARTESLLKEKTDSRRNRVNESVTVEMPLLNGEDLDVENEEEGTSLL